MPLATRAAPPMDATTPSSPHTPDARNPRILPTTIWLPAPDHTATAPPAGSVLPTWAIDQIRTDFARPGQAPEPLLKISLNDTELGMDTRATCTLHTDTTRTTRSTRNGRRPRRTQILLAELHPDLLTTTDTTGTSAPTPTTVDMPAATDNGWSGFFHRAHRLLPPAGLLLLATRQRRDTGILTDPLGSLIASARTAGFFYLQHIVIAHTHPAGDQLVPEPPADASPGVTHSDLIALTAIHHS